MPHITSNCDQCIYFPFERLRQGVDVYKCWGSCQKVLSVTAYWCFCLALWRKERCISRSGDARPDLCLQYSGFCSSVSSTEATRPRRKVNGVHNLRLLVIITDLTRRRISYFSYSCPVRYLFQENTASFDPARLLPTLPNTEIRIEFGYSRLALGADVDVLHLWPSQIPTSPPCHNRNSSSFTCTFSHLSPV